ncbi:winged helix-turn-helix transcriptional regulator [Paenibacillus sp. p3-SID867]|uniref:winged helix-turn-helix transcriptional regulator n=1 Tax=Paenibacillus sp. p3-SID867 TaxID=2916363 RepID=UPI0021A5558D|nr:winged helix-turn-helix transcriptional regulator [Paenibacillus sp. p3-SID867]MCT1403225.1 winged helix-turn-helix transcriptional regulator [Paenibacillus sp. p3-SID867]
MEIYVLIIFVVLVGLMVSSRMTAMEKRMKQQQNTLNQIANQLGIPEPPVLDHVKQLLADGQDIKAIKIVREELGLSLVEAKQYVDAIKYGEQ